MRLSFDHVTGDRSKQIRPCLCMFENYRFQFEIAIGWKIDCYQNFGFLSFPSRKNKPIKSM